MDRADTGPPSRAVDAARAAAGRLTAAMTRKARLGQVRSTVRTQLAASQQHRRELSQELHTLRKGRLASRSHVRSDLGSAERGRDDLAIGGE